jgi:alpha-methylacyl-CoA racemase
MSTGPLAGVKVVELAGLGPAPFGAMVLADLGADVIRVDRAANCVGGNPDAPPADALQRGRRSIGIDLKHPEGREALLRLAAEADVLIEGFRPGVLERLGLGPDELLARNSRLVVGRMTGWGQDGPLAPTAGHDIDYIALSGALGAMGRKGERPVPPLNLVGDFGGGGMLLALGVVAALFETQRSGRGQVVDAAMVDGSALLMTMMYSFRAMGVWENERGVNMLDSGAGFYDVYETSDGRYLAVGAIEPQFYAELLEGLGLADDPDLPAHMDRSGWPLMSERFAAVIATRTRDEWEKVFDGTDACVAPVLSMDEAPRHPHNVARGTFTERYGVVQAAPAPRFSRTAATLDVPPAFPGQHTDEVLADWGFTGAERDGLRASGAVR